MKKYHSKIDGWVYPIMFLSCLTAMTAIIYVPLLLKALLLLSVLFTLSILYTKYEIKKGKLIIICSILPKQVINISRIVAIRSVSCFDAAKALSADRLELFLEDNTSVIISPKNKLQFIEDLKTINKKIVYP